jgi:hypothetical protein
MPAQRLKVIHERNFACDFQDRLRQLLVGQLFPELARDLTAGIRNELLLIGNDLVLR